MPRGTIVVVGSANMDMYILLDRLPAGGETLLGREFQMQPGGKGANQAVAAARAGSEVFLVANLGDDLFGRNLTDSLQRERVAIDFVSLDRAARTGVAMILVDAKGENLIAVAPGANSRLTPAHVAKAHSRTREADFLLLQMEIPAETVEAAIDLAYKDRVPVVLNAAPAPRHPLSAEIAARLDTIVVNEYEAGILTGLEVKGQSDAERAARVFQKMGVKYMQMHVLNY